jgi:hypothetical protein
LISGSGGAEPFGPDDHQQILIFQKMGQKVAPDPFPLERLA